MKLKRYFLISWPPSLYSNLISAPVWDKALDLSILAAVEAPSSTYTETSYSSSEERRMNSSLPGWKVKWILVEFSILTADATDSLLLIETFS